jgi:inhibitor of cysteine peptidase
MIVVDESQCGGSVAVAQGDTLAVRLREQGTTGYLWTVEAADGLKLRDSQYVARGERPGAAGYHEFRFQAEAAGTHVLRFKHWRDWQGEDSVIGRCSVDVRVG